MNKEKVLKIYLKKAKKCEEDAKLIMKWRNNITTLQMSYDSRPKKLALFYQEYRKDYFNDHNLQPQFAILNNSKVGFLRFKIYKDKKIIGKAVDIGVNIDPEKRGLGIGLQTIKTSSNFLLKKGFQYIIAEIKEHNIASIKAFQKAGFLFFDKLIKRIDRLQKEEQIIRMVLKVSANKYEFK